MLVGTRTTAPGELAAKAAASTRLMLLLLSSAACTSCVPSRCTTLLKVPALTAPCSVCTPGELLLLAACHDCMLDGMPVRISDCIFAASSGCRSDCKSRCMYSGRCVTGSDCMAGTCTCSLGNPTEEAVGPPRCEVGRRPCLLSGLQQKTQGVMVVICSTTAERLQPDCG